MTIPSSVLNCMSTKLDAIKDNTDTKVKHTQDSSYHNDFMRLLLNATSSHDSASRPSVSPQFQNPLLETTALTKQDNNIPLKSVKSPLPVNDSIHTAAPSKFKQDKTPEAPRDQEAKKIKSAKEEKLEKTSQIVDVETDDNSIKTTSTIEAIDKAKKQKKTAIQIAETTKMEISSDPQAIIAPPFEKRDLSPEITITPSQEQLHADTKGELQAQQLLELSSFPELNRESQLTQWIQNGQVQIINLDSKIKNDSQPLNRDKNSLVEDSPMPPVTQPLPELKEDIFSPSSKLGVDNTNRTLPQPTISQTNQTTSLELTREQQEHLQSENNSPQNIISHPLKSGINENPEKNTIFLETHQQNALSQEYRQDIMPKAQELKEVVQQQGPSSSKHMQESMPTTQYLTPIAQQQNLSSQGQTQDNSPKPQRITPIAQKQNVPQESNLKSETGKTSTFSLTEATKASASIAKQPSLTSPKLMATLQQKIEAIQLAKNQMKESLQKGETHLLIKLSPDDLGKINLKLDIAKDGTLVALFKSDSQETITLLKNHEADFRQLFRDAGLNMDASSMQFSHSEQQASHDKNISSTHHKDQKNGNVTEETSKENITLQVVRDFIPSTHNKTVNIQV